MIISRRLPTRLALLHRASLLNDPIYAKPEVNGVDASDPEGRIPAGLIGTGLTVPIPRWPNYPVTPPRYDRLQVFWEFGGIIELPYDEPVYPVPPPIIEVHIPPRYLAVDGVAYLYYAAWGHDVNDTWSFKKKLTIDTRYVPVNLQPVSYPDALLGYLNCQSARKLWEGVRVKVPPDPGCAIGDWIVVHWNGYLSQNASGPTIPGTYKEVRRQLLTDADLREGVEVLIEPYVPHIEPMWINASAEVWYELERNNLVIRKSVKKHVMIDRVQSGQLPCGPP
ncbi:hypothetical protein [Pseudomonas nunensis]|uniref:hypothetical protein n=1 Tax=Pseudomonas nunensis TaxID=2961896 RepID=UPI000B08E416|nr:hypothetical protein [Pseudomonas nunensis]